MHHGHQRLGGMQLGCPTLVYAQRGEKYRRCLFMSMLPSARLPTPRAGSMYQWRPNSPSSVWSGVSVERVRISVAVGLSVIDIAEVADALCQVLNYSKLVC